MSDSTSWLLLILVLVILAVVIWWWWKGRSNKMGAAPKPQAPTPAPYVAAPKLDASAPAPSVAAPKVEAPAPVMPRVEVPVAAKPVVPDDLKIIEGIGPKIASLLNSAGIETFAALAAADVATLQKILDTAGLRLADPGTWAEQARLAAAGKMDDLQKLQDSLKGGRRA